MTRTVILLCLCVSARAMKDREFEVAILPDISPKDLSDATIIKKLTESSTSQLQLTVLKLLGKPGYVGTAYLCQSGEGKKYVAKFFRQAGEIQKELRIFLGLYSAANKNGVELTGKTTSGKTTSLCPKIVGFAKLNPDKWDRCVPCSGMRNSLSAHAVLVMEYIENT